MTRQSIRAFALGAILALTAPTFAEDAGKAAEINRKIGRAVNLGNALEAPKEGDWGMTLEAEYFDAHQGGRLHRRPHPDQVVGPRGEGGRPTPSTRRSPSGWTGPSIRRCRAGSRSSSTSTTTTRWTRSPSGTCPGSSPLWEQIAERYQDRPDTLSSSC